MQDLKSPDGEVAQLAEDLADSAPDLLLKLAEAILQIVTTLVFAFYLTADGPRFRRTICSRLRPDRQEIVLDTWEVAVDKTGAYLLHAGDHGRGLDRDHRDLPRCARRAVTARARDLGGSDLAVRSDHRHVRRDVVADARRARRQPDQRALDRRLPHRVQPVQGLRLGPRLSKTTLKVHPAVTIGSVFAGGLLFGAVGAVLALPAAAVVQALVSTYTEEQVVIESELTEEPPDPPTSRRRRIRIPRFSLRRSSTAKPATRRTRAGDENRTRVTSLEDWSSTTELHPRGAILALRVGEGGLEPPASCSQSGTLPSCATPRRHRPAINVGEHARRS